MPMPLVSSEVIESIRTQSLRRIGTNTLYCMDVLNEIKEENPNLAEAIKETIKYICSNCDVDINTPRGFDLMLNMSPMINGLTYTIEHCFRMYLKSYRVVPRLIHYLEMDSALLNMEHRYGKYESELLEGLNFEKTT